MAKRYFVSTDDEGVEHLGPREIRWNVPSDADAVLTESNPQQPLLLRSAVALLDVLDEKVFLATSNEAELAEDDVVEVHEARLAPTQWGPLGAARFALECVEHVTGDLSDVELAGHLGIGAVLKDARRVLDGATSSDAGPAARIARLLAIRRLRHESDTIEQLEISAGGEDLERDVDALDDPAWTSLSALDHAVFAVIEAVRHVVMPRYTSLRESTVSETEAEQPIVQPSIQMTPWGPIILGASYEPTHIPAAIAAREAALRARELVVAEKGAGAEEAEYHFQAARLEALLLGTLSD